MDKKFRVLGITSGIGSMLVPTKFDKDIAKKVEVVGNQEWRPYYDTGIFEENFKACYWSDWKGVPNESKENIDIVLGHPECFTNPDTPVLTDVGYRKIRDIKIGDLVLTHTGKFRKVVETRKVMSEIPPVVCHIKTQNGLKLSCTANHPLLTETRGWIQAEHLFPSENILMFDKSKESPFYLESVLSIETCAKEENMNLYNLGVEEDSSYIAGKGFVVHNCGNFSTMNMNREKRFQENDIREFVEKVAEVKPKFFLMDDLYRSLNVYNWKFYADLLPDYDIFFEPISNYHYGNIQKGRKRFFIVGSRKELKYTWIPGEKPDHGQTVKDRIGDLPLNRDIPELQHIHYPKEDLACGFKHDTEKRDLTYEELAKKWLEMKPGKCIEYTNKKGEKKTRIGHVRTHWDAHSHVLYGGGAQGFPGTYHPLTGYPFTARERARIQGFPDEFKLNFREGIQDDSKKRGFYETKVTGKAMPVEFCRYAIKSFLNHLERDEKFVKEEVTGKRYYGNVPDQITQEKEKYCAEVGYSDQKKACDNCWNKNKCKVKPSQLPFVIAKG